MGSFNWWLVPAIVIGLALQSYAHSMNSYLGYAWSKLDQGEPEVRSVEKVYTGGQSLLASGRVSLRGVLINSLVWLALALVLTAFFARSTTQWAWVPVLIAVVCPFWYEWGKLHWMPEIPLGLGFATAATWLGMATSGQIDWWLGAVASLPLFLIWGVWAEHADQHVDYAANWPKGGRSLGLLTAHLGWGLRRPLAGILALVFLAHLALIVVWPVLSPHTAWAILVSMPLFWVCLGTIDRRQKLGVLFGLAAVTVYQVAIVVGQSLA